MALPLRSSATIALPSVATPAVPRLLHAGAPLSTAELEGMCLDGLLVQLYGATYLRADERASAELRAHALGQAVPEPLRHRMTIGWLSAAFVYGCAPDPSALTVLVDHQRRSSAVRALRNVVVHEVDLPAADIVSVAGVPVTTPLRTACDIALYIRADQARPALLAFGANPALECAPEMVRHELAQRGRLPRKRAALALLDRILGDTGAAGG